MDDFSGPEEEPLMDCDEEDIQVSEFLLSIQPLTTNFVLQDSPPRGALSDKEPAVKPEVNRTHPVMPLLCHKPC